MHNFKTIFTVLTLITMLGCSEDNNSEINPSENLEPNCNINTRDTNTIIQDVTNPITGRIWMDRNLGASSVASSITDEGAFGDLYQWGRGADGHENPLSLITEDVSNSDIPSHGNYISNLTPADWRNPQNNNLWQGLNGINNPCPCNYRVPTATEFEEEISSWNSNDKFGAYNSVLKLPYTNSRINNGVLDNDGVGGAYYWTSTTDGTFSKVLQITDANTNFGGLRRAYGNSIRCIKD